MGPSDSRKTVAGAAIPLFTTAPATRSSKARSSVVSTSAPDLVEKAWEISARTLSHVSATDGLEKEVITVWKGGQSRLASGIIWRGCGGVNERGGMTPLLLPCSRNAHDQNVLVRRARWDQHRCHSMREERAGLEGASVVSLDGCSQRPLMLFLDGHGCN